MSLSSSEVEAVTISFTKVAPKSDQFSEQFYNYLFEQHPEVKPMFEKITIREQGRKLMQTLGMVVGSAGRIDAIIPDVQSLGKRHVAYGVKEEHYPLVGEALLWTLEQTLEDDFTPEVKSAWAKMYDIMTEIACEAYK